MGKKINFRLEVLLWVVIFFLFGAGLWCVADETQKQPTQIEQLQTQVQQLQEKVDTLTEQSATKEEVGAVWGISWDVSDRLAKVEGRK